MSLIGTFETSRDVRSSVAIGGKAEVTRTLLTLNGPQPAGRYVRSISFDHLVCADKQERRATPSK